MNGLKSKTHTHTGTLCSLKKEEILPFATHGWNWGHYAKYDKPDREGQILYGITYVWNLKKEKKIKLTETDAIEK